jgi:microcystin degradation protein MlrC
MGASTATDREATMRRTPIPVARFEAPDGSQHTVGVIAVKEGWQIVDQNGRGPQLVDTLTDERDGRAQAEAVARDYAEWAKLPTWARQ